MTHPPHTSRTVTSWHLVTRCHDIQIELNSLFDETDNIVRTKNGFMAETDNAFAGSNAESKVSGAGVQDSDTDVEFGDNDIENRMRGTHHLLRRESKTRKQSTGDFRQRY
ncbi:MAG: hypothetical protein M1839_007423 [Geoglossum umbratile]|nr:MAG: hypothetical protein M1839_007423 [Geoglossum umbratile]